MSGDSDLDAYKGPPSRTPVSERRTSLPNPSIFVVNIYSYLIDLPVTFVRDWLEGIRAKRKFYYYHRQFRRVPDVTECLEDDYLCFFEADSQWRRDRKVDAEILNIMKKRFGACKQREGESHLQNCAKELEQFTQVTKAFQDRYADLGVHGTARKCLMKQKHRMIAERKARAQAQAEA